MLCCGYTLTDFPISIRLTSLALWQSNDCPNASKATLMNMDKYFMWIHYERLRNHNKAKHNKTVCIFLGICCTDHHDGHLSWQIAVLIIHVLYSTVAINVETLRIVATDLKVNEILSKESVQWWYQIFHLHFNLNNLKAVTNVVTPDSLYVILNLFSDTIQISNMSRKEGILSHLLYSCDGNCCLNGLEITFSDGFYCTGN